MVVNAAMLLTVAGVLKVPFFRSIDARFDALGRRFDEAEDFWRTELRGFEGRVSARLSRLETR